FGGHTMTSTCVRVTVILSWSPSSAVLSSPRATVTAPRIRSTGIARWIMRRLVGSSLTPPGRLENRAALPDRVGGRGPARAPEAGDEHGGGPRRKDDPAPARVDEPGHVHRLPPRRVVVNDGIRRRRVGGER